jgi:glutaryl-CoA dehydrogenase
MRADIVPGGIFPDYELTDHTKARRRLSELQGIDPMILVTRCGAPGEFLTKEIEPVINRYWIREEFPHELIPGIAALGITGLAYDGYGCPGGGRLLDGMIAMELARVDPSISTFMGVHSGLAMGSIYLCGSEEQKRRWLPPMARMEKIGAFGLTEPDVGSGVAGGLTTTAPRR